MYTCACMRNCQHHMLLHSYVHMYMKGWVWCPSQNGPPSSMLAGWPLHPPSCALKYSSVHQSITYDYGSGVDGFSNMRLHLPVWHDGCIRGTHTYSYVHTCTYVYYKEQIKLQSYYCPIFIPPSHYYPLYLSWPLPTSLNFSLLLHTYHQMSLEDCWCAPGRWLGPIKRTDGTYVAVACISIF